MNRRRHCICEGLFQGLPKLVMVLLPLRSIFARLTNFQVALDDPRDTAWYAFLTIRLRIVHAIANDVGAGPGIV
jgi:hypothetical protein